MKPRFSVLALMGVVLLVAVGFAALHDATVLWASGLFTLTVVLLTAAVLGAMACRGRDRMTWAGFALFGGGYLLTTFGLWPETNGVTAPPYLTKAVLDYFQPNVSNAGTMTIDPGPQGEMSTAIPPAVSMRAGTVNFGFSKLTPFSGRVVNRLQYRRIGHTLAAILFGLIGAAVGRCFAAREDRPQPAWSSQPS